MYTMGNKLARTTPVVASKYYLHDLPASNNFLLKEALGGDRVRYLCPVAGILSMRNENSDGFYGDEERHDVKSLGMVSVKTETVVATKKIRNEGQEEAIREAMAAFMEMDYSKALKVPNKLRVKKVDFRDRFPRGEEEVQNGEEILEKKMNTGAISQEEKSVHNQCVAKETSGHNTASRNATRVLSGRSKLERVRGEISAQNIIKRAEYLIADSSVNVRLLGSAVSSFFVAVEKLSGLYRLASLRDR